MAFARSRDPLMERYVPASGLAVALLFGGGNALWAFRIPQPGASPDEIVKFYVDRSGRIVAGASISLVAIALFVFFASGVRRLLVRAEGDDVLGTTAFGGALLGAAAGLGAETINMAGALRAAEGQLSGSLAQPLFEVSQVLGFNAAGVGIGIFALGAGGSALRSGTVLPRWLALLTAMVGAALLTPLSRLVFGPAILLLGLIAVHLRRAPAGR